MVILIIYVVQLFLFTHLYVSNSNMREIKWWIYWCVTGITSFILIALRDVTGENPLLVVLQNTLMVSGSVFIYVGTLRFYGLEENRKQFTGIISVYVLLITIFTVFYPNVRIHTTITNIYLSYFGLMTAFVLLKFRSKEKSNAILIMYYGFLFHGLVFALRAVLVMTGIMDRQDFFYPDPLNTLTFLDGIITSLLWTFGFMVMINQRINRQMKESLDHFEQIFNASPDAATITNIDNGNIVSVNDHFTDITGFSKEEAVGTSVISLWKNPERRIEFAGIVKKTGVCENFQADFVRKDGVVINALLSAKMIRLKGLPHIITISRDITRLKENEKERERLKTEIQHGQRLQSIGTLAAGIAHEINSPLQFTNDNIDFIANSYKEIIKLVQTYKDLMMNCHTDQDKQNAKDTISSIEKKINLEFLTDEMPEALSQTKDGISRIRKIVNAMKQYSNMNLEEKKAADLNKTLENAEIISRNEWKYHAELVNEFDPELPFIECYEPELNQVFMNLIVNAAHATKDAVDKKLIEKGLITVKTSHKEGRIIIEIGDNGTGISKKIREKVYDPFFTTKDVGVGTGQGLAIAHRIINEKHKGKIWFESEENKGTTFFVELPL